MNAGATVIEIETTLLQPNPLHPREPINPESISELVDSIREHGILEPLLVAKTPAGYQIISGERRWQAAKILGITKVPAVIKEVDSRQMLQLSLVDNVQRKNLNPLERARAFQRLKDEFRLSWAEIAKRIGKSPAYIVNTVNLLKLPDALKDGLLSGLITEGHARALGGIEDTRFMIEAYKIVLKEKASVRRAEEIARLVKESVREGEESEEREFIYKKEEISSLVNQIKDAWSPLPVEVEIVHTRIRGRVCLEMRGSVAKTKEFIQKIATTLSTKEK